MNYSILLKRTPLYLVLIVIMAVTSILFCLPETKGKILRQDDIIHHQAVAHEAKEFRAENNEEPLWTTHVFSGMPTFNISLVSTTNVYKYLRSALFTWLPSTAGKIFLVMIACFVALVLLGVDPRISGLLAIAYGLSSNIIISLVAGHNSKIFSIAFLAPSLAGTVLLFQKKYLKGFLLTLISLGLLIYSNHYQIMYYYLLTGLIIGIVYLFSAIKEKTYEGLIKSSGLIIVAGLLALLPSFGKVYNVYSHTDETIRGGSSQLTKAEEQKADGGLDRQYAMRWSYGISETFSLIVPSIKGGASTEALSDNGNVAKTLDKFKINNRQKESILKNAPVYIGDQPFTMGPVYFGMGMIFLFILSLFLVDPKTRTWLAGAMILSLIIAWGRHFELVTGFLFDYFPMYNKFRTPSMSLAIGGAIVPLAAGLAFNNLMKDEMSGSRFKRSFKNALIVSGSLMVLALLIGLTSDWIGGHDTQFQTKNSPWSYDELYQALIADRKSNFFSDWFISLLTFGATVLSIVLVQRNKLKPKYAFTTVGIIFCLDAWHVSKRYMNEADFINENSYDNIFEPTPADQLILSDRDINFRVLNATKNPWTDAITSYHHQSVGGQSAAKLQRYQDLIEFQLSSQIGKLNSNIVQSGNQLSLSANAVTDLTAYNMLNTRYIIVNEENAAVVKNDFACGNAWFISKVKKVETADEEMASLANFDPTETAIIHNEFEQLLTADSYAKESSSSIVLDEMTPKYLKYTSKNTQAGLGVFSEIYYENGWKAYIDNNEVPIMRANYVLRALNIPAGEHTIEMKFEPQSVQIGNMISIIGSILSILAIGTVIFIVLRKRNTEVSQ